MTKHAISAAPIGYIAVILPLVTIHMCFVLSIWQSYVEPCFPYWLDCVSVSRTGRNGAAYFVFKGGMIPGAVLLFIAWQLARHWLVTLGRTKSNTLLFLSATGSLALLIYTLALGHAGDTFYILRRFGVVLFLFCSFISQLLVGRALMATEKYQQNGQRVVTFCVLILCIAIFSLFLDAIMGEHYSRIENAFEWWLIMLLIGNFLYIVRVWQRCEFKLFFSSKA